MESKFKLQLNRSELLSIGGAAGVGAVIAAVIQLAKVYGEQVTQTMVIDPQPKHMNKSGQLYSLLFELQEYKKCGSDSVKYFRRIVVDMDFFFSLYKLGYVTRKEYYYGSQSYDRCMESLKHMKNDGPNPKKEKIISVIISNMSHLFFDFGTGITERDDGENKNESE